LLPPETIQKIADLAETKTFEIDGRTVSTKQMFNAPKPDEPSYPTVYLATLIGLVSFVEKNPITGAQIVINHNAVEYSGPERGINRQRDCYAVVTCHAQPFNFGQFADLEQFRINLLTRFEDTEDRDKILEFISKLTEESNKTITDDGVSQSVQARLGIASVGPVQVPSPARLAAIRTFVEVHQPEGVFIFRLRKGANGPEAALFEIFTDWQRTAVTRLREHLSSFTEISDVPIYA